MEEKIYREYVSILKEELQCAMGCTEPIAVAYCAALARKTLGAMPERVCIEASANIIKNVKSVVVPHTGGKRGIAAAAAAGIIADRADAGLQVLSQVTEDQVRAIDDFLEKGEFHVERSGKDYWWHEDFDAVLVANGHYTVPWIPEIPGLQEFATKYPGKVEHSKGYRGPEKYRGKVSTLGCIMA